MSAPVVVGVGSPFGGDQAGWAVAARLGDLAGVRVAALDRPGPALLNTLAGAPAAVIVDAVHSGAAPGTLHRFSDAAALPTQDPASSHGLGLAEALALGERLGQLPPWVVVGVEVEAGALPGTAVLERAAEAVRQELAAFGGGPPGAPG
jgi:hydrogenase maturation protease